ncbi:MAG: winged helix-turn-helix transcriptional regulator [Bacilli bacterium]|nr:winged helix-turn-helix transcriptional regulator [Bacilli bacterium]
MKETDMLCCSDKCDCNVIYEDKVLLVKESMPDDEISYDVSDFFRILGDSTRIKILFALDNNELCVCDIANVLGMTKSSISHQLSSLKLNKIVKCRRDGKEVYYSLDDDHIKEVFEVATRHVLERREVDEEV